MGQPKEDNIGYNYLELTILRTNQGNNSDKRRKENVTSEDCRAET